MSTVIPMYKQGEKGEISKYRVPSSVASFIAKVFEKLVFNLVTFYLECNNLITNK